MQLTSPLLASAPVPPGYRPSLFQSGGLLQAVEQRVDQDETTTNAERDQRRSIGSSLRNLEQRSEAAVSLVVAGQDVYDSVHQLSGKAEPSSAGGRALEGAVSGATVVLGAGEIAAASEHFKKGENVLGAIGLASGLSSAASGLIGVAQATFVRQSFNGLPLDQISGVTAGVGSILDGVEDFHEVSKGAEKLVFGAVAGAKVAAGTLEVVGSALHQPTLQAIGSTLYMGSLVAQYSHVPDHWENDLAQHLAIYENLPKLPASAAK